MSPAVIGWPPSSAAYRSSSITRVKYCTPAARTSGSANGSSMRPLFVATARTTASNVVVRPSPEAGFQLAGAIVFSGVGAAAQGQARGGPPTEQQDRGDRGGHHHEARRHARRAGFAQQHADHHGGHPDDHPGGGDG